MVTAKYCFSNDLKQMINFPTIKNGIEKALLFMDWFYTPKNNFCIKFDVNDCDAIATATLPFLNNNIFYSRITFCRRIMSNNITESFVAIFIVHELMHAITGFGFPRWKNLIENLGMNHEKLRIPTGYPGISSNFLTIEDEFGRGSAGAHWKESTIGKELMTSQISRDEDPYLLPFTIGCVQGLGYCDVNTDAMNEIFETKGLKRMKEIIEYICDNKDGLEYWEEANFNIVNGAQFSSICIEQSNKYQHLQNQFDQKLKDTSNGKIFKLAGGKIEKKRDEDGHRFSDVHLFLSLKKFLEDKGKLETRIVFFINVQKNYCEFKKDVEKLKTKDEELYFFLQHIFKEGKFNDKMFKLFDGNKNSLYKIKEGERHRISHHDIKQGQLGDCFFLGPLSAMCYFFPARIKHMIKDLGNKQYEVTLFNKSNEQIAVEVDLAFPVDNDGKLLYAGFNSPGELHVIILEKAFAMLMGGYSKINGGHEKDALEMIIGKEQTLESIEFKEYLEVPHDFNEEKKIKFVKKKKEEILKKMKEGLGKNKLVFLGKDHSYAVFSIDDEKIEIYNPWGKLDENDKDGKDDGHYILLFDEVVEKMEKVNIFIDIFGEKKEKEKIQTEKEQIQREKEQIQREKEQIQREKEQIQREKEQIQRENNRLQRKFVKYQKKYYDIKKKYEDYYY